MSTKVNFMLMRLRFLLCQRASKTASFECRLESQFTLCLSETVYGQRVNWLNVWIHWIFHWVIGCTVCCVDIAVSCTVCCVDIARGRVTSLSSYEAAVRVVSVSWSCSLPRSILGTWLCHLVPLQVPYTLITSLLLVMTCCLQVKNSCLHSELLVSSSNFLSARQGFLKTSVVVVAIINSTLISDCFWNW